MATKLENPLKNETISFTFNVTLDPEQSRKFFRYMDPGILPSISATPEKKYAYGIKGIAETFGCSIPTASRIKASGKIDGALKQLNRKIVVDKELALELAAKKDGGRRK